MFLWIRPKFVFGHQRFSILIFLLKYMELRQIQYLFPPLLYILYYYYFLIIYSFAKIGPCSGKNSWGIIEINWMLTRNQKISLQCFIHLQSHSKNTKFGVHNSGKIIYCWRFQIIFVWGAESWQDYNSEAYIFIWNLNL